MSIHTDIARLRLEVQRRDREVAVLASVACGFAWREEAKLSEPTRASLRAWRAALAESAALVVKLEALRKQARP